MSRWEKKTGIREVMDTRGVRKVPGSVLIGFDNEIYEFVVGDKSQDQYEEIYEMLDEMGKEMRRAGYLPLVSEVLVDIDEEDKEDVLNHHSEKLAISFTHLKTLPGNVDISIMKFRKKFSRSTEAMMPDWREKYLDYKEMKQHINLIYPGKNIETNRCRGLDLVTSVCGDCAVEMTRLVSIFEEKLEAGVHKFNSFVMLKEDEYINKWQLPKEIAAQAEDLKELMKIHKQVVDFHGEMVLLQSYSALIGLVRILKKYDKRRGACTLSPFVQKLMKQPFFSTDVLNKIVKECQGLLEHLLVKIERLLEAKDPENANDEELIEVPEERGEIEHVESKYMKLTLLVLETLKEIRSGSSTVSAYSLLPMQI